MLATEVSKHLADLFKLYASMPKTFRKEYKKKIGEDQLDMEIQKLGSFVKLLAQDVRFFAWCQENGISSDEEDDSSEDEMDESSGDEEDKNGGDEEESSGDDPESDSDDSNF